MAACGRAFLGSLLSDIATLTDSFKYWEQSKDYASYQIRIGKLNQV